MKRADECSPRMHPGEPARAPVSILLGECITRIDIRGGELEAEYRAGSDFLNPSGSVQGGMLGAMLDALTAGLVDATLDAGESVATISLGLVFLRPAQSGPLHGRARLLRRGQRICHVSAELEQGGSLVATATASCTILRRSPTDARPPHPGTIPNRGQ